MIVLGARTRRAFARRAGVTVAEVAVSSAIFSIVAYGIVRTASMGVRAEQAVSQSVIDAKELHGALRALEDELCMARTSTLEHEVDDEGFSTITFQVPIEVEGVITWGAYEFQLGPDAVSRSREDWHLCYVPRPLGDGTGDRELVRLVLDDLREPQFEEVLVDRIAGPADIGFSATDTGALWVLTVRLPADENSEAQEAVIHVASNN